jgi:hypothetical protein
VHQPPTLKKNITMVEPFAWSSGMAMVLIANPSWQYLCNRLVGGADKGFYFILYIGPAISLFLAIALFAPLQLLLPPLPSPASSPATLVAIATSLFVAIAVAHPPPLSPLPSPCLPHPLCPLPPSSPLQFPSSLPTTAAAAAIALVVTHLPLQLPSLLPLLSLAHHPCCHCTALGGGGEDHTNLVRDPTSAATAGAAIIVATFAARATGREGLVQQRAGLQRPADSLRQRDWAAVGVCVAGDILLANQRQWRRRQHADGGGGDGVGNAINKVNKDNNNNMTATQHPTQHKTVNTEGE